MMRKFNIDAFLCFKRHVMGKVGIDYGFGFQKKENSFKSVLPYKTISNITIIT